MVRRALAAAAVAFAVALAAAEEGGAGGERVQVSAKNKGECDASFGSYAWIPRADLAKLGMPIATTCGSDCGTLTVEGEHYQLDQINVADGHDACGNCGCDLAYLQLKKGEGFKGLKCGQTVEMAFAAPGCPPGGCPPPPPPGPPPKRTGTPWERIGPRNIFDDEHDRGEAGTLATAASPQGSGMRIIYTGGQNNGASSGVLKTADGGATWQTASNGLYDTRVQGLFVYPGDPEGKHVLCGTPSGIWESTDGAASWKFLEETKAFGQAHTFRNASIAGVHHVLVSTSTGIANAPMAGGSWSLIKSEHGDWHSPLSVADDGDGTVVCGCLQGMVVLGAITDKTTASWTELPQMQCAIAAIDPNDKTHFLFSNSTGWKVWESTDGGKTARDAGLPENAGSFYVLIDRRGWFHTGAQAGAYRSRNKGETWEPFVVNMTSRYGYVDDRIPHDYQRVVMDFAGDSVAFPSGALYRAERREHLADQRLRQHEQQHRDHRRRLRGRGQGRELPGDVRLGLGADRLLEQRRQLARHHVQCLERQRHWRQLRADSRLYRRGRRGLRLWQVKLHDHGPLPQHRPLR